MEVDDDTPEPRTIITERPVKATSKEGPLRHLHKPVNKAKSGENFEQYSVLDRAYGSNDKPNADTPVFKPISLKNHLQNFYESLLISFVKSRHHTDNFMLIGPHGNIADGLVGDAREIYYDANAYIQRMAHGMKYIHTVNGSVRQSTYQNVLRLLASLTNTDAFLLTAFIFTWILTGDVKFESDVAADIDYAIKIDRRPLDGNLKYNTTGEKMRGDIMGSHSNDSIESRSRFYAGFDTGKVAMIDKLKEWFSKTSPEIMMLMFDAYQSEMDKARTQTIIHQEKTRRAARELRPRIVQNCKDLYETLKAIITDNDRLDGAIKVLSRRLDDDKDPFVLIYMKENESLPFYDREKRVSPVVRGEKTIVGRVAWRIIDVYRELASHPMLHFNRCLERYILSMPSNDVITMRDMDMLLYEATMPFYHSRHEDFLSVQFRMAYDFLYVLREQHRRFGNALQYMQMIRRAITRPDLSLTPEEKRVCLIDIPFDTLMIDAFERVKPSISSRTSDWRRYLDVAGIDRSVSDVYLKECYLYDYVNEVLYVKFRSNLCDMIITRFKELHGLFGPSPLVLSSDNMSIVCKSLSSSPFSIEKRIFDSHFRLGPTRKDVPIIQVSPLWDMFIKIASDGLSRVDDDETIKSLMVLTVEKEDIAANESAKLYDILGLVIRSMYQQEIHLWKTLLMRRDINVDETKKNLCTNGEIIALIEQHPDYFSLSGEQQTYNIPVFTKKIGSRYSLNKAIMPLLSREKGNTSKDGITWLTELVNSLPLFDSSVIQSECEVISYATQVLPSSSVAVTVGDLKRTLTSLANDGKHYVLIYRDIDPNSGGGANSNYPLVVSYEIINDVEDYDALSLSYTKSKLYVIVVDNKPKIVQRDLPMVKRADEREGGGTKTYIVLIETRSQREVIYEAITLVDDDEASKESIYARYNTINDVCIEYVKFERDANTSLILLTRESLGYRFGYCIYDIAIFDRTVNFVSHYVNTQRKDVLSMVKQVATTTKTKKRGGTIKSSTADEFKYRLTKEQVGAIRLSYKASVEKEKRFIQDGSMADRDTMIRSIIVQYINDTSNLTDAQLNATDELRLSNDTLRLMTQPGVADTGAFIDMVKLNRENQLIPVKNELLKVYMTPCYSLREYVIYNAIIMNWDGYTQLKYQYGNNPIRPNDMKVSELEGLYHQMVQIGAIIEQGSLPKKTNEKFDILYKEIMKDNGWLK